MHGENEGGEPGEQAGVEKRTNRDCQKGPGERPGRRKRRQDQKEAKHGEDTKNYNNYTGDSKPRLDDHRSYGARGTTRKLERRKLESEEAGRKGRTQVRAEGMGEKLACYGGSEYGMPDHRALRV